jgi:hypothetical protein
MSTAIRSKPIPLRQVPNNTPTGLVRVSAMKISHLPVGAILPLWVCVEKFTELIMAVKIEGQKSKTKLNGIY